MIAIVEVVVVVVTATVSVMMIVPGDVMIVGMMIAPGNAMTAVMMIAVVTAVMSAVTGAMMVVVGAVIVYPLDMSTPNVKSARNMATLQVSAGGVTLMTRRKEMTLKREHTLHHMGLTQIGMLTLVLLITLPAS
jgi:hypothetical protein